jgi:ubiquinone/menaquinone biosynthesis C-methylase UbiE
MNPIARRMAQHMRKPGGGLSGWLAVRIMIRRNRPMNDWAVALLDVQPTDQVLEIGFGAGRTVAEVARRATQGRVAGVDFSPEMVRQASRHNRGAIQAGRVELKLGDVMALPYADDTFDKAFCVGTIYYWPDPVGALREMRRVLKPGGRLVLLARDKEALAQNPAFVIGNYQAYTREELTALFTEAGFIQIAQEHRPLNFPASATIGTK